MCYPRKLAQDVILSAAKSAAEAAVAAVDAERNYNSTHHAAVVDKAAVALSISSFHLHSDATDAVPPVRWTCAHSLPSSASLRSVRLSARASVCLILDMRTQYSSPLSQFIFRLRPKPPPLLDVSTECVTCGVRSCREM